LHSIHKTLWEQRRGVSCDGTWIHHWKLNSDEAVHLMESFEFASEKEV
jgi:hypothetical protein